MLHAIDNVCILSLRLREGCDGNISSLIMHTKLITVPVHGRDKKVIIIRPGLVHGPGPPRVRQPGRRADGLILIFFVAPSSSPGLSGHNLRVIAGSFGNLSTLFIINKKGGHQRSHVMSHKLANKLLFQTCEKLYKMCKSNLHSKFLVEPVPRTDLLPHGPDSSRRSIMYILKPPAPPLRHCAVY